MRYLIDNFPHKLGMNCLTTAARDILHYNGYDYAEDFVLGLSGAFSFWYSKNELFIQATGVGNNIFEELAAITKIQHQYVRFEDNQKAWDVAMEYVKHDIPVVLDVELAAYVRDIDAMSDSSQVEKKMMKTLDAVDFHVGGHVTTLIGGTDDSAYLIENMFYKPVSVPKNSLMHARNPENIQFVPPYNGLHAFHFPEQLPELKYMLKTAIIRVIHNMEFSYPTPKYCFDGLAYNGSGLKGIKLFFHDIEELFSNPTQESKRQVNSLAQILNRWGGNELNRANYARFLKQAASILEIDKLTEAAAIYNEASRKWKLFLKQLGKCVTTFEQEDIACLIAYSKEITELEQDAVATLKKAVMD